MSDLPWLSALDLTFPDIDDAMADPNGLLAAGGDLSAERLLCAYQSGIFPWFEDDQPILWWSPDPRCVIDPSTFKPSKSLKKTLRRGDYTLSIDTAFGQVISQCRTRGGLDSQGLGTWITGDMQEAYIELHNAGYAHSFECYFDNELVGGLYGVSLGRLFFGESMFHRKADASKIAFAGLMSVMKQNHCPLVDCQMGNDHLYSLGAMDIPRDVFKRILNDSAEVDTDADAINWQALRGPFTLDVVFN